jgi:VanZ family protein
MDRASLDRNSSIVTALVVVMIIYGSLYPFEFRVPAVDIGPVTTLFSRWDATPGRGDFISNILLYMPLGFFGRHVLLGTRHPWLKMGLVVLAGAALSIAMELTQYYDAGRDTEATDVYSNVLGTLLGAIGARAIGTDVVRWTFSQGIQDRVPLMLLIDFLGYRLFPFLPVIDLHKYFNALKPILYDPSVSTYDLFRHTVVWLTVAALLEQIVGHRRSLALFPLLAAFTLVARILILSTTLSLGDILGAALATFLWFVMALSFRLRFSAITTLLFFLVTIGRLVPFEFADRARAFGWIPFHSFMVGSIDIDVQSFFEKFFLYGSLLWLFGRAGFQLRFAAPFVAAMLFVTSQFEVFLPDRSAEVTDAVMALIMGVVIGLVKTMAPSAAAAKKTSRRGSREAAARPRSSHRVSRPQQPQRQWNDAPRPRSQTSAAVPDDHEWRPSPSIRRPASS